MRNKHGEFIWYELLTSDLNAAKDFYGKLIGWSFADSGNPDVDYHIFSAADVDGGPANGVGGMMEINDEMKAGGARPLWLGYVGVDDVDATVDKLVSLGGKVMMPAMDVPGAGRMAMVTDPQGVPFYVMRGAVDAPSRAFAMDKPRPGHCAWNELATTDQKGAWRFYGELFGWTQDGAMDMGPMGEYQFVRHGGVIGAIMPRPEEMPVSLWSYYFRVHDIDEAVKIIKDNGGQVMYGPGEVPGGGFIISGLDPQGALLNLIGERFNKA